MNTPAPQIPRGIRNKNPGNIRHSPNFTWSHELQPDDEGFCRFDDPMMGIRAMMILFRHYQEVAKLSSIGAMIRRWAPNTENDTSDYIRYVASRCQTESSNDFDFSANAVQFCRAIVSYENGQDPYDLSTYQAALQLATHGI